MPSLEKVEREMRLTQKQYEALKARIKRANPKSKSTSRNESLVASQIKEEDTRRARVTITSYRVRLCDPDNPTPKYHLDALRHFGVIRNDRIQDIDLVVNQVKVKTRKDERTEIEVIKS